MTIQKDPVALLKIRELLSYTFLPPDDPNFIDLNEIYVAIDSDNILFNSVRAKKIPISVFIGGYIEGGGAVSQHIESGQESSLSSVNYSKNFDTAFTLIPIGVENIICYKYVGGYRYNYILKDIVVTINSFSFTFEDVSGVAITDFTGIIVEYNFNERS